MTEIPVAAHTPYIVQVGRDCTDIFIAQLADRYAGKTFAVITDDHVNALYGDRFVAQMQRAGLTCCKFVFSHGEAHKSLATVQQICEFCHQNQLTRSDMMLALGGGIVGDIAGFAAAMYLRGIAYVQVPTTLLAQIDSSVGGKTAANLPQGKNLIGCFWQPVAVLCDTAFLDTLPEAYFADGIGEAVKYGAIWDRDLFLQMQGGFRDHLEEIVACCVAIKAEVVRQDEFDTGVRMLLNFGHTMGHAIERHSNFAVSHGKAVAMGMVMMAAACVAGGLCPPDVLYQLCRCLQKNKLATHYSAPVADLLPAAMGDKKRDGSTISIVQIAEIGRCVITKLALDDFRAFLLAAQPLLDRLEGEPCA